MVLTLQLADEEGNQEIIASKFADTAVSEIVLPNLLREWTTEKQVVT